jgi:hypothetical protein
MGLTNAQRWEIKRAIDQTVRRGWQPKSKRTATREENAAAVLDFLQGCGAVSLHRIARGVGLSYYAANVTVKALAAEGRLIAESRPWRGKVYSYWRLDE